jgi:hypothetical protein
MGPGEDGRLQIGRSGEDGQRSKAKNALLLTFGGFARAACSAVRFVRRKMGFVAFFFPGGVIDGNLVIYMWLSYDWKRIEKI